MFSSILINEQHKGLSSVVKDVKIIKNLKRLFFIWIIVSIALLALSFFEILEGSLAYILGIVLLGFYYLNVQTHSSYKFSVNLIIPFFFSLIITISLLENYLLNVSGIEDGYSISNKIAYLIIGEDGWNIELFKRSYETSFWISVGVLLLGSILFLIEWNKKNRN